MADKLIIRARIEEVPILAQFTHDHLNRDLADFTNYKPSKYTAGYLSNIITQKNAVEALVNPRQLTAELSVVTLRLLQNLEALKQPLNLLEGYVEDAAGLTVQPKHFGIKEVRQKIARNDQEGLNLALLYLIGNINNNMTQLMNVDFPAASLTTFQTLRQQIFDDNALQNVKLGNRAQLVLSNMGVINGLAAILKEVWADGKRLYRLQNKVKAKDYSNADLVNRIRQEELKTKISGTVMDENEAPVNRAKVEAIPVTGKRKKTVYTKTDGSFVLASLKPGMYNLRISKAGFQTLISQTEAVTSQITDVDVLELIR